MCRQWRHPLSFIMTTSRQQRHECEEGVVALHVAETSGVDSYRGLRVVLWFAGVHQTLVCIVQGFGCGAHRIAYRWNSWIVPWYATSLDVSCLPMMSVMTHPRLKTSACRGRV